MYLGTKYYLSLEEYPYDKVPPFVSSEALVLSKSAVQQLYYGSFFTKYLRYDDIYLGLVAKKMGIEPYHSNYFKVDDSSFRHNPYGGRDKDFRYLISVNNFDDEDGLQRFWDGQKALGNA